jgi:hypothetical protein
MSTIVIEIKRNAWHSRQVTRDQGLATTATCAVPGRCRGPGDALAAQLLQVWLGVPRFLPVP